MITPLIAAYFLKSHGEREHEPAWVNSYVRLLKWTLHNRWKTMLAGLVALGLTVVSFVTLPMTFFPEQDRDFSTVRFFLPPGSTLERTEEVARQAREIVSTAPEVYQITERVSVGNGSLSLMFKDDRERSSLDIERSLAPQLSNIADARVNFQSQSFGGPEGGGGGGRDINVFLGGEDPALLSRTANKIADEMAAIPGLRSPRVQGDLTRPEVIIQPRLDLAADLGVTTSALGQTIRLATIGDIDQNSARFSLADRQVPIRVLLPEEARRDLSVIENLPVPTSTGGSVPLKAVAEIRFGSGPIQVSRTNQVRRIVVGADLAPGAISGDVNAKIDELPTVANLPTGVTRLSLGASKQQAEMINNFLVAVVTGVLLLFGVLVLLYRRLLPPLVNMGSLLLAPLGAAVALHLTGNPMSMPVFIGLLMLLGIVAKNSILLVDFALEELDRGVERFTAITEAGHKRAQPIVMTTIAMVAGMIPSAAALHGDSFFRGPMGITVIGGLLFSTVLTLLIVPAAFSLSIGAEQRLGPKLRRWFTNNEGQREGEAPGLAPQPAE
jgi:multidrug efflux pump subunit AcrB